VGVKSNLLFIVGSGAEIGILIVVATGCIEI
jgi:hypothetical protein